MASSAPAKTAATAKVAAPKGQTKPVPETILKKRRTAEEIRVAKEQRQSKVRTLKSKSKQVYFQRAQNYFNEYKAQEKSLITLRRTARAAGNYYLEPEAKVAVVIRIRGIIGLHPKPRKILQLLRLKQINNAVFVKLNKATINMLRLVEPYVTYGYPNLKSVKELVYKRGFAKINRQRIAITDNHQIQQNLGKQGLVCLEDIVHEIYTVGPHFKEASNFLWPFKLNPPKGGWDYVKTHFNEGGDAGNREDTINQLLRRMV